MVLRARHRGRHVCFSNLFFPFVFLRKRAANSKKAVDFCVVVNLLVRRGPFYFFVPVGPFPPNLSFSVFSSVRWAKVFHLTYILWCREPKDIFLLQQQHQEQQEQHFLYSYANKSASRQQLRFKTCNRCASSQILKRRRCRARARVIALILITALLKNHHHLCCHPFPEDDENEKMD